MTSLYVLTLTYSTHNIPRSAYDDPASFNARHYHVSFPISSHISNFFFRATLILSTRPSNPSRARSTPSIRIRVLSIDVALACLLFTSIVYERNDKLVAEAADLIQKAYMSKGDTKQELLLEAERRLKESEVKIQAQVNFVFRSSLHIEIIADCLLKCSGRRHNGAFVMLQSRILLVWLDLSLLSSILKREKDHSSYWYSRGLVWTILQR